VFVCQTGLNPWFLMISYVMVLGMRYRIVCVTDDAIYVMRSGKIRMVPKEVLVAMPRQTRLGPVRGIWARMDLDGRRHWVLRRFHRDVRAADATAPVGPPRRPPRQLYQGSPWYRQAVPGLVGGRRIQ
jgi:hypothetical protein